MGRRKQRPAPVVVDSSSDDGADSHHDSGDDNDEEEPIQPAEIDLYAEFNIPRDASEVDIKKAYRRMCLLYHPDKLSKATETERLAATEKFQQIAAWYGILSDPAKRARYDQTGSLDERGIEFMDKGNATWYDFFRNLWGELTLKDIDEYAKKYHGSDEEKRDVLDAFAKTKGNLLRAIDEHIPLSHIDELPRYRAIVQSAMNNKEIPRTTIKEDPRELKKLRATAAREFTMLQKAEAEKASAGALSLLAGRAEKRKQEFGDMIANLTEKYVKNGSKRKGGKRNPAEPPQELSDADFEAFQQGLMEKRGWKVPNAAEEKNKAAESAKKRRRKE
ncbi:hypothetical protein BDZ88DRAFT_420192 [Geranomyces variabilis]|nr:hypothetical protein BDZ88DRAFT_420192 [Geranomyces variabilis]KAJ3140193.1 hypothetical protein HDU90_008417 [Geranomyces variabilis]